MALNDLSPEALIKHLSWRPAYINNSMIAVCEPTRATALPRVPELPSMGSLDVLPTELLNLTLNLLDFRSLSHFVRTSHLAKTVVELLPAYRDVVKHASTALLALSRTRLITFHSAVTVHAALLADSCVFCQDFAPFLYLPTCERCCYECLHRERSLRVITLRMAGICFGLSPKDLERVPIMVNIPGTYSVGFEVTCRRVLKLVSFKQAKQLGISIHGSEEAMTSFALLNARKTSPRQRLTAQWLTKSKSNTQSQLQFKYAMDTYGNVSKMPVDTCCGMASVKIPSLRLNGVLDHGLWCLGCQNISDNYDRIRRLHPHTLYMFNLEHITLSSAKERARSKSDFLEHVMECKGASELFQSNCWLS